MSNNTQVVYRAPLCSTTVTKCGNRTWSPTGLCPVHRTRKEKGTALLPSGVVQRLASPNTLRREQKRDKRASKAISSRVGKVVPIFEGDPTVDDIESAGQHILYRSWADEGVRHSFQEMEANGLGAADMEPRGFGFASVSSRSEAEVASAARRRDSFGMSAQDASLVSGYLLHKAWEMAQAEAIEADSEGIPFDVSVDDYLSMKAETLGMGNPNFESYRASIRERVTAERDRRRYMAEVEQSRMETMVQAAQELGTARMNAEVEGVDPKELAWGTTDESRQLGYTPSPRFRLPRSTNWKPVKPSPAFVDEETGIVYDRDMNPLGRLPGRPAQVPLSYGQGPGVSVPEPGRAPRRVQRRLNY